MPRKDMLSYVGKGEPTQMQTKRLRHCWHYPPTPLLTPQHTPTHVRAPCQVPGECPYLTGEYGSAIIQGTQYVWSKPPLATDNLLENTDGVRSTPPAFSRGVAACYFYLC